MWLQNSNLSTRIFVPLVGLVLFTAAGAQTTPPSLQDILDRAAARSAEYIQSFRNLLAVETRSFEVYDKNGDTKKTRTVKSTFIVYPLAKSPDKVMEFRNVTEVDGSPVKDAEKRAQDFFEKVSEADSSDAEMKRLRDESSRHDLEISISGMTLFQAVALDPNLRPLFEFTLGPASTLNGRAVYRVDFKQTRDSPDIGVNSEANDGKFHVSYDVNLDKKMDVAARLSGYLIIDAETFRLYEETRNLSIQPAGAEDWMTVIEEHFTYQDSPFGILVPKSISHVQYEARTKENKAIKDARVMSDYQNFSRADVEVKSSDVKPK